MIGGKRLQGDSGRVGVRVEKYPPHPSLPPPGGKELWRVLEQKIFVIFRTDVRNLCLYMTFYASLFPTFHLPHLGDGIDLTPLYPSFI